MTPASQPPAAASGQVAAMLMNPVMFVVGFQFQFFTTLASSSLVQRALTMQFGERFAAEHGAKYTSALLACSHFCNGIANPFWGRAADRVGRRPIMLLSLASAAIAMMLFAICKRFWVLFLIRAVAGLLDSSMFVAKVVIGDVTTTFDDQSRRFSHLYIAYGLCLSLGSFIVGMFEHTTEWTTTGPCLFAAATTMIVFFACLLKLPETMTATSTTPTKALLDRKTTIPIVLYGLMAMLLAAGEMATALFIAERRPGGLSLPTPSIGLLFTIQGVAYLVSQTFFCESILSRLGAVRTFRWTALSLALDYAWINAAAYIPFRFVVMSVQMSIKVIVSSIAITAVTIIINRSTTTSSLGSVMSLAQSLASFCRTICLLMAGSIYDFAASRDVLLLPFALVVIGIMSAFILSYCLSDSDTKSIDHEQRLCRRRRPPCGVCC